MLHLEYIKSFSVWNFYHVRSKIPVERLFTEWEFLSTNQAHWLLPVCKGGGWQIVMGHMIETQFLEGNVFPSLSASLMSVNQTSHPGKAKPGARGQT